MNLRYSLILMAFVSSTTFSQSLRKKADTTLADKNWKRASNLYQKFLKENEPDSSAWYNLALSQLQLKQYENCLFSLSKAETYNFPFNLVEFQKAKVRVLSEQDKAMIEGLEKASKKGFSVYKKLLNDSVFSSFYNDERFKNVLNQIRKNAYPCLSIPEYRHFDFWLGEWNVYSNGRKAGINKITLAEGGCAIHESYTTAGNYAGQSINFYDPIDKKWHQHWVGSSGDVYNYVEVARSEGMLQFESKFMNAKGQISLSRLTFTLNEDATVRQLFESSTDNGNTWTPFFNGLYVKIKMDQYKE